MVCVGDRERREMGKAILLELRTRYCTQGVYTVFRRGIGRRACASWALAGRRGLWESESGQHAARVCWASMDISVWFQCVGKLQNWDRKASKRVVGAPSKPAPRRSVRRRTSGHGRTSMRRTKYTYRELIRVRGASERQGVHESQERSSCGLGMGRGLGVCSGEWSGRIGECRGA